VFFSCRSKGNRCLLMEDGKMCMGPSVDGGCNALCPSFGFECYGCRGPVSDANVAAHKKMLRDMGHSPELIEQRFMIFAGPAMKELEEKNKAQ
jgi:sulfhydrogenase subunit delta